MPGRATMTPAWPAVGMSTTTTRGSAKGAGRTAAAVAFARQPPNCASARVRACAGVTSPTMTSADAPGVQVPA